MLPISDSKYEKIAEKLPEIDKLINETAIGWDTQRMGKVELTNHPPCGL